MKHLSYLILFILVIFSNCPAQARPLEGFNSGPYLYLEGGAIQVNYDRDQYSNIKHGRDFEPTLGLIFGWNIRDWIAAELEGKYGTNIKGGKREHLVGANLSCRYFFITDILTKFKSLRIMPILRGGLAFKISSLPGNENSTDTAVTSFGWGPSFGIGLNFLILKYLSFGIDIHEDLIFFDEVRQNLTVNGASLPNTLIYQGGFKPQFNAIFYIGVHY